MRCPTLRDLPAPPRGKIGWPWTEESPQLADTMQDGSPWPRVSIVTPSYNQVDFIEETIRSVLLQGYPNLEYVIVDGGSTDGSVGVIREYADWLTFWVSEKDQGQSHAIMKGFGQCSGDIYAWLNSDDVYFPEALGVVACGYRSRPVALLFGDVIVLDQESGEQRLRKLWGISLETMVKFWLRQQSWDQTGLFFPRIAYEKVGDVDISLSYTMDYDLICRFLIFGSPVVYLDKPLARLRRHTGSKTQSGSVNVHAIREMSSVSRRYWHLVDSASKADEDSYWARELLGITREKLGARQWMSALLVPLAAPRIGCGVALRTAVTFVKFVFSKLRGRINRVL